MLQSLRNVEKNRAVIEPLSWTLHQEVDEKLWFKMKGGRSVSFSSNHAG